jgi:3-hydroxyacyl-CoA dehydrogenase
MKHRVKSRPMRTLRVDDDPPKSPQTTTIAKTKLLHKTFINNPSLVHHQPTATMLRSIRYSCNRKLPPLLSLATGAHQQPQLLPARRFFASDNAPAASPFASVGIVGLGLMGHGIAQVAAQAGIHQRIVAYEPETSYLEKGRARIVGSLSKLVKKEKLTQAQADAVLGRLDFTTDIAQLSDMDLIVEAVIENLALKKELYTNLSSICKDETVFASNTSSLSIAEMAAFTNGRQDRFVGVHFFNPVQMMKLVEVIRTDDTSDAVFDKTYQWVQAIHKVPVRCKDTPGFIVNRLLVPSILQAILLVERGDASVADTDVSLQLGAGHPMGPLHLADYIGLDTLLYIVDGWVKKYPNEPSFCIPSTLQKLVDAGHLGRKTGLGFYHWTGDQRGDPAV